MNTIEHIPYLRNGKKWYFLSIFYSREKWSELIADIKHFYEERQSIFDAYLISFSNEQGEHLQVTFVTMESDNNNHSDGIQMYFQSYLSKNPSVGNQSFHYGKVIWCNYPNNSLAWDRFKLPYYSDKYIHFHQKTMEVIIKLLDGNFSRGSFFSVGVYLIIKGLFCIDYSEQKNFASQILNEIPNEFKDNTNFKEMINRFDFNKISNSIESYRNESENDYSQELINWLNEMNELLKVHKYKLQYFLICKILGLNGSYQIVILLFLDLWYDRKC